MKARLNLPLLCSMVVMVAVAGPVGVARASSDTSAGPGWYIRGDVASDILAQNLGYWHGPGPGPGAPRITFGLDAGSGKSAGVGFGYDWGGGIRADLAFTLDGNADVTGRIQSVSNGGSTASHTQTITAGVTSQSAMVNAFLSPLEMAGYDSAIQPFITAGLGASHVSMGDWTRYNPMDARVYRTFYGAGRLNLAWSVGAGVEFKLGDIADGRPVLLDVTYRYSDLGNVSGSSTPLPGNGNGDPLEAFNFDLTTHALTVGLRVPLGL